MSFIYLILLIIAEIIIGMGILSASGIKMRGWGFILLALITGIGTASLILFTLEILHIPLTVVSVFLSIGILTILAGFISRNTIKTLNLDVPKISLYEWPWLTFLCIMCAYSIYRGVNFPSFPRDALAGPEPIAEYALREHKFINSVFELDFSLNNNPFKSLYLSSLQLIDKLLGFTYGKIWILILSYSFVFFIYILLRQYIHPILSGVITASFLIAPEVLGFTFMILYDVSNMIFFFLSIYFLREYMNSNNKGSLAYSAFLMAIATYIRPETMIICALIVAYVTLNTLFKKKDIKTSIAPVILFLSSALAYLFTSYLYLNYYLPVTYDVGSTINDNLLDLTPLFMRMKDMLLISIYSKNGIGSYGYFFFIATILLMAELIVYREMTKDGKFWLAMFLLTFIGIAIIGYLFPLANLLHTTKRALLKAMPILAMYMANNKLLLELTKRFILQPAKVVVKK